MHTYTVCGHVCILIEEKRRRGRAFFSFSFQISSLPSVKEYSGVFNLSVRSAAHSLLLSCFKYIDLKNM